jgi:hypothetical protein
MSDKVKQADDDFRRGDRAIDNPRPVDTDPIDDTEAPVDDPKDGERVLKS